MRSEIFGDILGRKQIILGAGVESFILLGILGGREGR